MKIIKVINNNVVSALDKDAEEVVIMGKGIGFHAKPGQIVNEEQIEKTFRLEDKKSAGSSPGWWRGFRWNISSYPTRLSLMPRTISG